MKRQNPTKEDKKFISKHKCECGRRGKAFINGKAVCKRHFYHELNKKKLSRRNRRKIKKKGENKT